MPGYLVRSNCQREQKHIGRPTEGEHLRSPDCQSPPRVLSLSPCGSSLRAQLLAGFFSEFPLLRVEGN